MISTDNLRPTLWRSCRVLANRTRLQILKMLAEKPKSTVSSVARQLQISLPAASQYLKSLEARGFLTVSRKRNEVFYCLAGPEANTAVEPLLVVLRAKLKGRNASLDAIFKLATAFTHPRRLQIYKSLDGHGRKFEELRFRTGISRFALARHLAKLEARGFVAEQKTLYFQATPKEGFGQALAKLALTA